MEEDKKKEKHVEVKCGLGAKVTTDTKFLLSNPFSLLPFLRVLCVLRGEGVFSSLSYGEVGMNPMVRVLVGIALVAGLNGGVCADEKAAAGADAELARLRNDITALVGPASCANLVNCRIAALGVSACGGPAEHLAYSWRSTDKTALETKIAEYDIALEDAHKRGYPVSACAASPQPVAACVNGRCVVPAAR